MSAGHDSAGWTLRDRIAQREAARDLWVVPVLLGIATFAGCLLFVALTMGG